MTTARRFTRTAWSLRWLPLAAGLLVTAVTPASAQTLGDVLREHGWDRVIGTWVDADTGGKGLRMTFAWRFKNQVVEITTQTQDEETVALMGRNPRNGDIYHFGATSRGGSSIGKWDVVDGDAVISLGFTGGNGDQGGLRVRHHFEDDATMTVTIEGEPPIRFRMVRTEDKGGGGKKEGANAKPGKATFTEGMTFLYIEMLVRNLDTDGNMTVEDEEMEKGFLALLARNADSRQKLLTLFDGNGDGTLDKTESRAAREFVFALAGTLLYDADGDWKLDAEEGGRAFARLAEEAQRHNEGVTAKFDANKDGKLDPDEKAQALKRIRDWEEKAGK